MHQLYCYITGVYRWSVAKRCIERLCVGIEEVLDIGETLHLEFLWFLLDHLPVKRTHTQIHHRDNNGQAPMSPGSSNLEKYVCVCVHERPVQSWKEAARAEKDGANRKHGASLIDPVEVTSGHVSHADGSSWTVQELVAISDGEREKVKGMYWYVINS